MVSDTMLKLIKNVDGKRSPLGSQECVLYLEIGAPVIGTATPNFGQWYAVNQDMAVPSRRHSMCSGIRAVSSLRKVGQPTV